MKKFIITVNGKAYDVEVNEVGTGGNLVERPTTLVAPTPVSAPAPVSPTPAPVTTASVATATTTTALEGATSVVAPMPGKVLSVAVNVGDSVNVGQVLCILEAMKMQNEITAPVAGTISEVRVEANQTVATAEIMIVIG